MNSIMKQALCVLLALVTMMPAWAQDAASEPRAVKGGHVQLALKNIPSEDAANVSGDFTVNRGDGTITLPYLKNRIRVEGLTARDIESVVRTNYVNQQIYADPIVQVVLGTDKSEPGLDSRHVLVSGYVAKKATLPYREGITLIEALLDAGDITDYGSRKIQVTRGTVTRTYDYFSARDRSIRLLPNDSIFVPRRPAFETRPSAVGP